MPLKYNPGVGCVVMCKFDAAFKKPEMVKPRPAVIVSPPVAACPYLCTIVPLSTSKPQKIMSYHLEIKLPFILPKPFDSETAWVKADMIYAAGFHRLNLFRAGKDENGKRQYSTKAVDNSTMLKIRAAILHGLGMGSIATHIT